MKNKILKLRITLWVGLALVVGWLTFMKIVPTGHITYQYNFAKQDFFIRKLTPPERVNAVQAGEQKVIGDPVYFSLFTPRHFNQAHVSLKYKINETPTSSVPIVELGVLVDKRVWRYDLKPIYNRTIEELGSSWDKKEENRTVLLQKNDPGIKKYENIQDFLSHLPNREQLALYNYDLPNDYQLKNYRASSGKMIIDYPLRGIWQLYTYIQDEVLNFEIKLADMNLNLDPDPVDLNLYYDDELIDSRHLDDDGETHDSGTSSFMNIGLKAAKLPTGVYKLELKANDDIITRTIITNQSKLSFINRIWLNIDSRGLKLYTNSRKITAQTVSAANLGTIKVSGQPFKIDQTYKQFSFINRASVAEIELPKGDFILAGDRLFAFPKNSLFDPDFKKVDANFELTDSKVNYILARYNFNGQIDDWLTQTLDFDLNGVYRENGKYSFLLSIPGLKTEDATGPGVTLSEIKIKLTGKNLWEYFKKIINKK